MPDLTPERLAARKRINTIILAVAAVCALAMGGVYLVAHDEAPKPAPQAEPSPAAAPAPLTTEEVRARVESLLAELDVFKDSSEFRQCVYGCQQGSMGREWNRKREALQERMTPELDVPVAVKAAPGELWALGMAYAKGKADEARRLRADIEKALAR